MRTEKHQKVLERLATGAFLGLRSDKKALDVIPNMTNLRTKPRPFTLASEAAGAICDSAMPLARLILSSPDG